MSKKNHMRFVEMMLKHSMECLKVAQTLTFLMVRWSGIELSWQTLRVATLLEPPNLWFSASCRSSWGFPKMRGFAKNHGFFLQKMIILGCEMGVPPFKKTPSWTSHFGIILFSTKNLGENVALVGMCHVFQQKVGLRTQLARETMEGKNDKR